MTGHHESTGPDPALSRDSIRRVSQYQTTGVNARLRLFALMEAQGVPASEADNLVAARRPERSPGRRARSWSWTAWRRLRAARCSRTAGMTA